MIRNQAWYNLNSTREYPLDDSATALSDAGDHLPQQFLADLHVRFPNTLGKYLFVSSATVNSRLTTFTLLAANRVDTDRAAVGPKLGDFSPIAAFAQPTVDIFPYRMYPLEGLADGVGGWVAFGAGLADLDYTGKFSEPEQTLITPRCARGYTPFPVESIGKQNRESVLQGLIRVLAGSHLIVEAGIREIDGKERTALILRLNDVDNDGAVFRKFIGPCGGRPESQTCLRPGIERINGVVPDCQGNIEIDFTGPCLQTYPALIDSQPAGGIFLDSCIDIETACVNAKHLPNDDGRLPNDYLDLCESSSQVSSSLSQSASSLSQSSASSSISAAPSESSYSCPVTYPFMNDFNDRVAGFTTKNGVFQMDDVDSPYEIGGHNSISMSSSSQFGFAYGPRAKEVRNVAVWSSCAMQDPVPFTLDTHLEIPLQADQMNSGFVLNYQLRRSDLRPIYYLIELNASTGKLEFRRYNGFGFTEPPLLTASIGISPATWYAFRVVVTPPTGVSVEDGSAAGNARITASVWEASSQTLLTTLTLPVNDGSFGTYTGQHGIGSRRSTGNFSFWRVFDSVYGGPIF